MIRIFGLLFVMTIGFNAMAHPPGLSSIDITLRPDSVTGKVTFAIQDIEALSPMDTDQDAEVSDAEREAAKPAIAELITQALSIKIDGNLHSIESGNVDYDDQNNATVKFRVNSAATHTFAITSKILNRLSPDHKQYVAIKDIYGKEISNKLITPKAAEMEVNLTPSSETTAENTNKTTFIDFLKLGIEHIVTGYDHLLFLFSLLVITRNFWPAIKIITFFTLAHSLTLALAGLNIIEIPSSIVEPLIAATIVYVGLENLIRKNKVTTKQRCFLTFFFGLIHGFGFAGVLREMGISSVETGILVPLFSFNLGVELGQITIAAIVLPIIWWLHKKETVTQWVVPVGSVLTCLAGGYWLIERTLLS
jgi:hydrogenase/urease accessory protein HupE